jgi:glycosyltransferase involved in cell wall biosynthesis
MSYLVSHLSKQHSVTLLTFDRPGSVSFYPLPNSASNIALDRLGARGFKRQWEISSRLSLIRREARRLAPDVVISFMDTTNVAVLLSCMGLRVPTLISERIDPSKHQIGWLKKVARASTYPFARAIIVQTTRVANYFPTWLRPKIRIIANPIPIAPLTARTLMPNSEGRMRVIAVGRLESQKGFDRLIDAFALVADKRSNWDLAVIGEGPERVRLEKQICRHGLKARIRLMGAISDVSRELAASHLMAFPSLYEGFPNALAEGLAAGLPAVGNLGVSGVEELIITRKTGLLVDQAKGPTGFASALAELMDDADCRSRFGEEARQHVLHWSPDKIFSLWDDLLAKTIQN